MKNKIFIFENPEKIAEFLIEKWFEIGNIAQRKSGSFVTAISGGNTPLTFYKKISAIKNNSLFWSNTHIFQVDERCTPHDSPDNNFNMIKEFFLDRIKIPEDRLHRMNTENISLDNIASNYENEIHSFFQLQRKNKNNFDLIILGLGQDGHTASLFPKSKSLVEMNHMISFVKDSDNVHDRLTMTFPLINKAENIFFIVSGKGKAEIVKKVLENTKNTYPANLVRPERGSCYYLLDKDAASHLSEL